MERSNSAVKTAVDLQVDGKHWRGRPKMTWKQLWKLLAIDPHDRHTWRSGVRSDLPCMQQASYLERGPLMWMLPLYLLVNQKSDDDDDDIVLKTYKCS